MEDAIPDAFGRQSGPLVRLPRIGPVGATALIGQDVVNLAGEPLGQVKEIMLDMRAGEVSYAVLAFGGFLGIGDKLFAVPWRALRQDAPGRKMILDVAGTRLAHAPGFDKARWPDMADRYWKTEIDAYYGLEPAARPLPP